MREDNKAFNGEMSHRGKNMSGKPLVEVLTRGGKREGAGRKPRVTPREAITVRLDPQYAAKLRDLCAAREVSQADWITDKIRRTRL